MTVARGDDGTFVQRMHPMWTSAARHSHRPQQQQQQQPEAVLSASVRLVVTVTAGAIYMNYLGAPDL